MFERYPQIFAVGNAVKARSSVVDRCAKSMLAFTSELHTLQPGLNLDVKTDSADMAWIAYVSPEVKALENRTHDRLRFHLAVSFFSCSRMSLRWMNP